MFAFLSFALCAALLSWVAPPSHHVAGGIEGRVTVRQLPAKVSNRYAGAGGTAAHAVEPLPAIVFIEGQLAGAAAPTVAQPEMAQRDTAFSPGILIVPVGTTVRFPNEDKFFHNVFSYSKTKRFDLGRYPKGEAKNVTFDESGQIGVFCEIHKWMRGAIVVVENKYFTTVKADGSYNLPNVPAGKYKVSVWHPERGKKTFDVTVPQSGTVRVDASF